MDPDGTSIDDLDVHLDWPGAESERAAESEGIGQPNGAIHTSPSSPDDASEVAPSTHSAPPLPAGGDLRATLAAMSARLDALAATIDASRVSQQGMTTAIEMLVRSVSTLTQISTDAEERSTAALHELTDTLAERGHQLNDQLEALRRRITLRGRGEQFSSEEMVELIADAVAERIRGETFPAPATGQRRRRRDR